jgi:SPP1 family predicted phage head-tail adaptor
MKANHYKRHAVDIGKLRSRITIQRQVETPDDQGGRAISWVDVCTVWAYISPVSERERIYSQAVQYRRSHKIYIRYRTDIDTSMQVLYDGRTFQIKATIDLEEQKFYTHLDCEENVGT